MLSYISRVQHLRSLLKSTDFNIDGQEMAMAILNILLEQYKNIITAFDALDDDSKSLTLELVNVGCYTKSNEETRPNQLMLAQAVQEPYLAH